MLRFPDFLHNSPQSLIPAETVERHFSYFHKMTAVRLELTNSVLHKSIYIDNSASTGIQTFYTAIITIFILMACITLAKH